MNDRQSMAKALCAQYRDPRETENQANLDRIVEITDYGRFYACRLIRIRQTAEGDTTTYTDTWNADGTVTGVVTKPSGAVSTATRSADGSTLTQQLSCGGAYIDTFFGRDERFDLVTTDRVLFRTGSSGSLSTTSKFDRSYTEDALGVLTGVTDTVILDRNLDGLFNSLDPKATRFHNLNSSATEGKVNFTSPEGRTAEMIYTKATLLVDRLHASGFYDTKFEYYPVGHDDYGKIKAVKVVDPSDALKRQAITTYYPAADPLRAGLVEKSGVDLNLDSVLDASDRFTTYDYDALGRVVLITGPDSNSVSFGYDKNGNMTVLRTPHNVDHAFGYNEVDLNDIYATPLSGAYTYEFDRDRRPTRVLFPSAQDDPFGPSAPDNRMLVNTYISGLLEHTDTPEGRIDYIYTPCRSKLDAVRKYDGVSMMTEETDLNYDGTLLKEVVSNGTLGGQKLEFTYRNGDLALTSFSYAGATESYSYDDDGLLTGAGPWSMDRETSPGVPNATGLAESISDGILTVTPDYTAPDETLMDGAVYGIDYTIGASNLASWDVTRNGLGQIDYKAEAVGGNTVEYDYTYDTAGRLDGVWKDSVLVEDYAYDAQGRRTGDIDGRAYAYDNEDHLTSVTEGVKVTGYNYDLDGFLTQKDVDSNGDTIVDETTTYVYGARGELISVELPNGTFVEYVNSARGQRIAKRVDGVVVEKYLWADPTMLLAVLDGNNNVLRRFEYAGGALPVAVTQNDSTYYLHLDQVGSLRAITDDQGIVLREVVYDSFGNIISDSDPSLDINIGFAGGLYDADTGLTRFGFRDYSSEIGRWTAKDPIGFAAGDTDLYGYCRQDPVNKIDRLGLACPGGVGGSDGSDPAADWVKSPINALWGYGPDWHHGDRAQANGQLPSRAPHAALIEWSSADGRDRVTVWPGLSSGRPLYVDSQGGHWTKLSPDQALFHGADLGYSKYIGLDDNAGREAVYDDKGCLVTNPEYAGSYNYADPEGSPVWHIIEDVIPYYLFGN